MSKFHEQACQKTSIPQAATLVGRVWNSAVSGPSIVKLEDHRVIDITATFTTMRDLCESDTPAAMVKQAQGNDLGDVFDFIRAGHLLAPIDLQVIKAAGVTFAVSMLERVIEEKARGNPQAAADIRSSITTLIGNDLSKLKAGSAQAQELKKVLIAKGAWSQYLEVGIGPYAEIFTKAPVLSAVGHGAEAGINKVSNWNNPEPEVVVVINARGEIIGATLGNDVNLRDIEGLSGLLLGKAKDNNASCALGPFIRLFDDGFTLEDVRKMELTVRVEGEDGYVMTGTSNMAKISRDPADLVSQMMGPHHQYPDGAVLFLGTLFAPVEDRDVKGEGFTHKVGDIVSVASKELGALVNRMVYSQDATPWAFGFSALMKNLAKRGLL